MLVGIIQPSRNHLVPETQCSSSTSPTTTHPDLHVSIPRIPASLSPARSRTLSHVTHSQCHYVNDLCITSSIEPARSALNGETPAHQKREPVLRLWLSICCVTTDATGQGPGAVGVLAMRVVYSFMASSPPARSAIACRSCFWKSSSTSSSSQLSSHSCSCVLCSPSATVPSWAAGVSAVECNSRTRCRELLRMLAHIAMCSWRGKRKRVHEEGPPRVCPAIDMPDPNATPSKQLIA